MRWVLRFSRIGRRFNVKRFRRIDSAAMKPKKPVAEAIMMRPINIAGQYPGRPTTSGESFLNPEMIIAKPRKLSVAKARPKTQL